MILILNLKSCPDIGSPPYDENMIFILKAVLIAQNKRPGALNSTQNTIALYKVWFLKNQEKTSKNFHFWLFRSKMVFFLGFFLNFEKPNYVNSWGFCVAFSASGRFFWISQNSFWTLFHIFHWKFWKKSNQEAKSNKKMGGRNVDIMWCYRDTQLCSLYTRGLYTRGLYTRGGGGGNGPT